MGFMIRRCLLGIPSVLAFNFSITIHVYFIEIQIYQAGWPTMPTGAIRTSKNNNPDKKSKNNADNNNPYFNADSNNPDNLCKLRLFL